jgi:transposase InsO family protein
MIAFIDTYKDAFGVEPICEVLQEQKLPIAPSTYYASKVRPQAARSLSDERLLPILKAVHADNFSVYGARKMWHAMRREGEEIGRDQVSRLMRLAGLRGVSRRERRRAAKHGIAFRAGDLVQRRWFRGAPNVVWVCDYTFVRTLDGWVYVSFVQDAFTRRILGYALRSKKGVELATRPLLQAVSERERSGVELAVGGVIIHSDAGSEYTSLAFTQKVMELGLSASVGRVGTAHDNALIESTIGLYKAELVDRNAVGWRSRSELEAATARWVHWFNHRRLHGELGYRPPVEFEMEYIQACGQIMPAA